MKDNRYSIKPDDPEVITEGRIYERDGLVYLGYTNSSIAVGVKAGGIKLRLYTGLNESENAPGIRIYINGAYMSDHILDGSGITTYHYEHRTGKEDKISAIRSRIEPSDDMTDGAADSKNYLLYIDNLDNQTKNVVKIVKYTEAAMSYVGIGVMETVDGELTELPSDKKNRVRVEFIGDSITCGYGIHSPLAMDNYTLWDEDGEDTYAAIMAKKMDWDARWISASGYGMYVNYEGDITENVPKLYPYVNWYLDKEKKIIPAEFEPDYIFINLGTNDSGHLDEAGISDRFEEAYAGFIKLLKEYHPDVRIICIIGTLCVNVYSHIETVVNGLKEQGYDGLYCWEIPYHTPDIDGVCDGHPTLSTHRKDAERILKFMSDAGLLV